MREPAEFARQAEEHPALPPGTEERVSGYGVMGLPFRSGHVLGLRRWTASSVGEAFTSVWHRDPAGRWTFYESLSPDVACCRFFGAEVDQIRVVPIDVGWEGPRRLNVTTRDGAVEWVVDIGSTLLTRTMSMVGSALPLSAWRSPIVLGAMGRMAGRMLQAGRVNLTGLTSNRQHFDANPLRVWFVTGSRAWLEGVDLGAIGPLEQQAHMADFYFPQRGIFAVGRVFVEPIPRGVIATDAVASGN